MIVSNEFLTALGHLGATVINNVSNHAEAGGIGSGLLFFVLVHTMPSKPPATFQEYWTWVREALQTLTPARYGRPTEPEEPAQEQK